MQRRQARERRDYLYRRAIQLRDASIAEKRALLKKSLATGKPLSSRSLTLIDGKRQALHRLYHHDARVSPWTGTAHGVLQAVNTYEHHEGIIRATTRSERNMLRTITGDYTTLDRTTWTTLQAVLR